MGPQLDPAVGRAAPAAGRAAPPPAPSTGTPGQSSSLSALWASVGADVDARLEAVALWSVELPFVTPVATARGVHRTRELVFVEVVVRVGAETVHGWGECAALGDRTYDSEDTAGTFEALRHRLIPSLMDLADSAGGRLSRPSRLDALRETAPDLPLAFSALEMAVADAHLRCERRSLAALLGVSDQLVRLGAVVGASPSVDALVDRIGALVEAGFGRVKMKIAPAMDVEPLEAAREEFPHLLLQADANGAYPDEPRRLAAGDRWSRIDRQGLLCIEQPFSREKLEAHAALAATMSTPICLDESLSSPGAVDRALALGACSVVCVKPARLGGIGAALEVVERCTDRSVPLWMGGMFESGYGRGVLTTIAALPGFRWPGDLSPARTYLTDDVVDPPDLLRSPSDGVLAVRLVGADHGMGPPPDPAALARHLVGHHRTDR